jgi:hypothetical protein
MKGGICDVMDTDTQVTRLSQLQLWDERCSSRW